MRPLTGFQRALDRAVLNTGRTRLAEVQAELYDQGVEVSDMSVRRSLKRLGRAPS